MCICMCRYMHMYTRPIPLHNTTDWLGWPKNKEACLTLCCVNRSASKNPFRHPSTEWIGPPHPRQPSLSAVLTPCWPLVPSRPSRPLHSKQWLDRCWCVSMCVCEVLTTTLSRKAGRWGGGGFGYLHHPYRLQLVYGKMAEVPIWPYNIYVLWRVEPDGMGKCVEHPSPVLGDRVFWTHIL